VGGTSPGAGDVSSGNHLNGVVIGRQGQALVPVTDNFVQGNLIGTDAGGTLALGNIQNGVLIGGDLSRNNTVGGTTAGARNVISGNNGTGIWLEGTSGSQVQGNFIGTNASGTAALGNLQSGVLISGGATEIGRASWRE